MTHGASGPRLRLSPARAPRQRASPVDDGVAAPQAPPPQNPSYMFFPQVKLTSSEANASSASQVLGGPWLFILDFLYSALLLQFGVCEIQPGTGPHQISLMTFSALNPNTWINSKDS